MFEHDLAPVEWEGNSVTSGSGRFYDTPHGEYPSMTTVLSEWDTKGIDDWVKRVGKEEANKVRISASHRGSQIHEAAERYIKNQDDYKECLSPSAMLMFLGVKDALDKHVGLIRGIETPLYSKKLRMAGRSDLIADWDEVPSIIDFKQSNKPKKEAWIDKYYMQTSGYAMMFEERTGFVIDRVVVIVTVHGERIPQMFVSEKDKHISKLRKARINYYDKYLI